MTNIPFPNSHDADALNDFLDQLVAGKQATPDGDVQQAAAEIHARAQQSVPIIPDRKSGNHTGGNQMQTATYSPPISNRTRRSQSIERTDSRRQTWLIIGLVAALLFSVVGYGLWNGPGGSDDNNNIAWAPGTVTPMDEQPEPLNPETSPWIADFQNQDCRKISDIDQVEVNYAAENQTGPQGYAVVGPANFGDGLQVSENFRAMRGCINLKTAWAYWSEARIYEYPRVLNENNQAELAEMERYFGTVYPEQFMATAEGLQVSPEVREEWESRLQQGIVGQPIPMGAKLNPAWAVELSDGRIAIPATFMYSVHDPAIIENGLPIEYPASTVVIMFTMEGNEWKYDDSLQLCIVNCQSGMGSPLNPEVHQWAEPVGAVQCPDDQGLGVAVQESLPFSPDRSFTTIGTPAAVDMTAFSEDHSAELSCTGSLDAIYTMSGAASMGELNAPGSAENEALAPYFIQSERGGTQIVVENPQFSQIEVVEAPPYTLTTLGPGKSPIQSTIILSGSMDNVARTKYHFSQIDMNRAVLLEDGRIALTTTVLLSNQDRGAIYYEGDPELFPMPIIILKHIDGEWLIDEAISVPRYVGLATPSYSWWWDSRYVPTPAATPGQ